LPPLPSNLFGISLIEPKQLTTRSINDQISRIKFRDANQSAYDKFQENMESIATSTSRAAIIWIYLMH
jgi:hypothetical protein